MTEESKINIFKTLYEIDVTPFVEIMPHNKIPYLEWATAWRLVKEKFPEAQVVIDLADTKLPFFETPFGLLVHVGVMRQQSFSLRIKPKRKEIKNERGHTSKG